MDMFLKKSNVLKLPVYTKYDKPIFYVLCYVYRSSANNRNLFFENWLEIFNDLESDNECTIIVANMNMVIRGIVNNDYLDMP